VRLFILERYNLMIKYLKKSFIVHLLAILLVEGPAPFIAPFIAFVLSDAAFADENTEILIDTAPAVTDETESGQEAPISIASTVNAYIDMINSSDPFSAVKSDDGATFEQAKSFIQDPQYKEDMDTPVGKRLMSLHSRFLNYFELEKKMETCLAQTREEFTGNSVTNFLFFDDLDTYIDGIDKKILNGTLKSPDVGGSPCHALMYEETSLDQLLVGTLKSLKKDESSNFEATLYEKSFKNITQAWLKTKYSYDKDFAKGGSLSNLEREDLERALCGKPKGRTRNKAKRKGVCSEKQKEILDNTVSTHLKSLKESESIQRFSILEAKDDINTRIGKINEVAENTKLKIKKSIFWDSVDHSDEKTQEATRNYQQAYLDQSLGGAGNLMWTDRLQESAGLKVSERRNTKKQSDGFQLNQHTEVTEKDVSGAIAEALDGIKDQAQKLGDIEKIRIGDNNGHIDGSWFSTNSDEEQFMENRRESMEEYVSKTPFMVGQNLADNPSAMGDVCQGIKDTIANKRIGDVIDNSVKYVAIAGASLFIAAGSAVVIAAVGTGVAAAVSAGTVSALIPGAVSSGVVIAGKAYVAGALATTGAIAITGTAGDLVVSVDSYSDAIQEQKSKEDVHFSGLGDVNSKLEIVESRDDLVNAKNRMYTSATLVAADVATLGTAKYIMMAPAQIKRFSKSFGSLSDKSFLKKINKSPKDAKVTFDSVIRSIDDSPHAEKLVSRFNEMNKDELNDFLIEGLKHKSKCKGQSCKELDDFFELTANGKTSKASNGSDASKIHDGEIIGPEKASASASETGKKKWSIIDAEVTHVPDQVQAVTLGTNTHPRLANMRQGQKLLAAPVKKASPKSVKAKAVVVKEKPKPKLIESEPQRLLTNAKKDPILLQAPDKKPLIGSPAKPASIKLSSSKVEPSGFAVRSKPSSTAVVKVPKVEPSVPAISRGSHHPPLLLRKPKPTSRAAASAVVRATEKVTSSVMRLVKNGGKYYLSNGKKFYLLTPSRALYYKYAGLKVEDKDVIDPDLIVGTDEELKEKQEPVADDPKTDDPKTDDPKTDDSENGDPVTDTDPEEEKKEEAVKPTLQIPQGPGFLGGGAWKLNGIN
jgi:hypothetical protein